MFKRFSFIFHRKYGKSHCTHWVTLDYIVHFSQCVNCERKNPLPSRRINFVILKVQYNFISSTWERTISPRFFFLVHCLKTNWIIILIRHLNFKHNEIFYTSLLFLYMNCNVILVDAMVIEFQLNYNWVCNFFSNWIWSRIQSSFIRDENFSRYSQDAFLWHYYEESLRMWEFFALIEIGEMFRFT